MGDVLMITITAAYPAALLDLPPLGQTGLTDASMNNNNNNIPNPYLATKMKRAYRGATSSKSIRNNNSRNDHNGSPSKAKLN